MGVFGLHEGGVAVAFGVILDEDLKGLVMATFGD